MELEIMEYIAAFITHYCAVRGNKEGTIIRKLQAVNFYHESWLGMTLPLDPFKVKTVRKGIQTAYVGAGSQPRSRKAVWENIQALEVHAM